MHVHQVQAELAVRPAGRDQKILLRERIGRLVAGEAARGVVVGGLLGVFGRCADFRPAQVGGNLGQAVGEVAALVRIDDAQRARPPVVVRHAREHHAATAGDRPRLGEMVGPDRLVAPEVRGAGAVLVGRPEFLQTPQRLIGVFPAGIDHAAVVQQRRHEVRFAVAAYQVDVRPVGVAAGEDIRVDERPAANVGVAARGGEEDVAVGQVERVDVVVLAAVSAAGRCRRGSSRRGESSCRPGACSRRRPGWRRTTGRAARNCPDFRGPIAGPYRRGAARRAPAAARRGQP